MITRWQLTGERVLMVEGTDDQRFVLLLQGEGHFDAGFSSLLVLPADAVEISSDVVARHGFTGTGAKQRVVAFIREVEDAGVEEGFRGVVDRDLDYLLSLDFSSSALRYTDYGSLDVYAWSSATLRRLLIQFRCETRIGTPTALELLYSSINAVCAELGSVRLAALRHPEWDVEIHRSTNALSVSESVVRFDVAGYLRQAKLAKGVLAAFEAALELARREIGELDPLNIMNGHDLLWVLVFVLRELSDLPRRLIDEATVAGSLIAVGVMDPQLRGRPLFVELSVWAAA